VKTNGLSKEHAPLAADSPSILDCLVQSLRFDTILHRQAGIVFAVHQASGHRNCSSRHHLGNEHDTSSNIIAFFPTDVEAQIYFIEIGVKRNWETAQQLGVAEPKADQGKVRSSVE
jgi:hypothetical protein